MLKLEDVFGRWELLGMSKGTFRQWCRRHEEKGEEGLLDGRLGRRFGRAVPDAAADKVERRYREGYCGFTAKHFDGHLKHDHAFGWATYTGQLQPLTTLWNKLSRREFENDSRAICRAPSSPSKELRRSYTSFSWILDG